MGVGGVGGGGGEGGEADAPSSISNGFREKGKISERCSSLRSSPAAAAFKDNECLSDFCPPPVVFFGNLGVSLNW